MDFFDQFFAIGHGDHEGRDADFVAAAVIGHLVKLWVLACFIIDDEHHHGTKVLDMLGLFDKMAATTVHHDYWPVSMLISILHMLFYKIRFIKWLTTI